MDISTIFNTYPGMYITQSFCHSTIAFLIVERTIHIWKITDPFVRQRFRILIILAAVFSIPLYQIINPERGSIMFRQSSLFDSKRWLYLELPGSVPLGMIFIIILFMTSLIFIFQELIPVLRHAIESEAPDEIEQDSEIPHLKIALEGIKDELPEIKIIKDEDFILYSTTGRNTAIFLSTGIINSLTVEQLKSVIAHELAHIRRNKIPLLSIIFILKVIMFFNPFILIEFRRITQEEEKICDDMAVSITKDPEALSEALKKLYSCDLPKINVNIKNLTNLKENLEEYSHIHQIDTRVRRLKKGINKQPGQWEIFVLVSLVIMVINYFVV